MINPRRVRKLNALSLRKGPIIYWMSRDQRAEDNWALLYAQDLALDQKVPLITVFCLTDNFLNAPLRHYAFMLKGLEEVEEALDLKQIPFIVLKGNPPEELAKFAKDVGAGAIVTDFDPLKIKILWKREAMKLLKVPFYDVDARNIVPCFVASPKQEFGAYTIRSKIEHLLDEFLEPYPALKKHHHRLSIKNPDTDWKALEAGLKCDRSVAPVKGFTGGSKEAKKRLRLFIKERLPRYAQNKNDPSLNGSSNLSPYLHFGHISSQRIALEVKKGKEFLEELIIRRELADNFCFHNQSYDSFAGIPDWAKRTLTTHKNDYREYIYSLKNLEEGNTHDPAWNAAQMEMVTTGKMHGYMRMYWAKKILEWSPSPEKAIEQAIFLNDKYELDGRDPNGYTGILWAIGGLHDRPWSEREIFGMVRYMNLKGLKSKFDIDKYISSVIAREERPKQSSL